MPLPSEKHSTSGRAFASTERLSPKSNVIPYRTTFRPSRIVVSNFRRYETRAILISDTDEESILDLGIGSSREFSSMSRSQQGILDGATRTSFVIWSYILRIFDRPRDLCLEADPRKPYESQKFGRVVYPSQGVISTLNFLSLSRGTATIPLRLEGQLQLTSEERAFTE